MPEACLIVRPRMVFIICYNIISMNGMIPLFDTIFVTPGFEKAIMRGCLRLSCAALTVGVLAMILGGCGGGGGGTTRTPPGETSSVVTPPLRGLIFPTITPAVFEARKRDFEASPEYAVDYTLVPPPPDPMTTVDSMTSVSPPIGGTDRHLGRINAAAAYARGATGMGETITVVDTGIRETHREFSGVNKVSKETSSGGVPTDANLYHGTFVSALAVGNRDGRNMHGVAYDANVHLIEIPLDSPGPPMLYMPTTLMASDDQGRANFYNNLISRARGGIINFSFGRSGAISSYTRDEIRRVRRRTAEALAQTATAAADKKIIVWAAGNAGRTRALSNAPEFLAGLGVYFPELRPHVLAVVALDQDGRIADYSNRCGIAKSFCLAAPGSRLFSAGFRGNTNYLVGSGTSFAAPLVSGSLALLRQYFRGQLGNTELVARLLATADKTGRYADSNTYGAGLVDLDAATRPSGQTVLFTGMSFNGPAVAEALSSLTGGAAFGDALARGLANLEIAAFDALDAPFFRPLGAYLRAPAAVHARLEDRLWTLGANPRGSLVWAQPGAELRIRFEQAADPRQAGGSRAYHEAGATFGQTLGALSFTGQVGGKPVFFGFRQHPGWRLGLRGAGIVRPGTFSDDSAFASPYLALARNGGSAGLTWPLATGSLRAVAFRGGAQWGERRDPDTSHALGAVLEYQFTGRVRAGAASGLAVQVGWLREPKRLIGSRTQGAFGALNGGTGFAGMSAHARIGSRWSVFAATHLGWSHPQVVGQGLLQDVSPLVSSAFSVGMAGGEFWQRDDRLSLRVSQPLRVEAGHAAFRWVAGRTRHRQVRLREATLNLAPSARQLDVELAYALPVGATGPGEQRTGALNLAALASHHPNHSRTATEYALLFRYQQTF